MPTRRNPSAPSDEPPSGGPLTEDALHGYLSGVRHRLAAGGIPEPIRASVAERLATAEKALERGALPDAERALLDADAQLDRLGEETELTEFPRGLVGYVPRGARGSPPPREEEPLANRMLIVERLWEVRRSDGYDVQPLLPALHEAEAAYRAGDRGRARRLVDQVHTALEALEQTGSPPREV
ncbi:MAG: hypothetical protein L3K19_00530 [Thermoplasmata archaeon]|nr:hypothetical protein [Thermoplasmata archaeon]